MQCLGTTGSNMEWLGNICSPTQRRRPSLSFQKNAHLTRVLIFLVFAATCAMLIESE